MGKSRVAIIFLIVTLSNSICLAVENPGDTRSMDQPIRVSFSGILISVMSNNDWSGGSGYGAAIDVLAQRVVIRLSGGHANPLPKNYPVRSFSMKWFEAAFMARFAGPVTELLFGAGPSLWTHEYTSEYTSLVNERKYSAGSNKAGMYLKTGLRLPVVDPISVNADSDYGLILPKLEFGDVSSDPPKIYISISIGVMLPH